MTVDLFFRKPRTAPTQEAAGIPSGPAKTRDTEASKTEGKAAGDRTRAFHLRQSLSHLDRIHEEEDLLTQKTREELRACRQRMDLIRRHEEAVTAEIATERAANNMAAVGRLQAASRRLCMELENEQELQQTIRATLKGSEVL
ncbi:cilia- and flagella-associated protein 74-like [Carlito syrichta]|uniref:Cilia- and flagella-associated protein 74-like n=1 Tax=Carlito syrichta TaxID=1868482 RepID=A0A3Q0DN88_CARSF|nr:cilia- and flagella-associated protein 74-like [Carlito syrichta]